VRVLVTGANGFLGARIATALRMAGHEVIAAVRNPSGGLGVEIACDFSSDVDAEVWKPRLVGIDAVINCAGILRETHTDTFQHVHIDGPLALFHACADQSVRRVIQLSALGEPQDGEFIASKHRGDAALAELDLDWLVLRPGLVYSVHGAYGGTSLLRALAALPGFVILPRDGSQELRPISAEDLAQAMVAALARPQVRAQVLELIGPEVLTLRTYLLAWRHWFGLRAPLVIELPRPLAALTVSVGEWWGRGPLCRAIANLLERRRVGADVALARMQELLGIQPQALATALAAHPSNARDLRDARWYAGSITLGVVLAITALVLVLVLLFNGLPG